MRTVWGAVLLVAAACNSHGRRGGTPETLPLNACHLTTPEVGLSSEAKCGTLVVPLNRNAHEGEKISLRVAVIPAVSANPKADPVFILAGGPGQAITSVYPTIEAAWHRVHVARDIVLVDQRGTGGSAPLTCAEDDPLELDYDLETKARQAHDCAVSIGPRARFFGTAAFADDLDDVRAALGYDRINLYGGSYGTEAAVVYGERHPDHVRTLVLDGVMSQTTPHGETTARDAQDALDGLFLECAADTACHEAFPDPAADLAALLRDLATSQDFTVAHPLTELPVRVQMSRDLLSYAVLNLSYTAETTTLLPLLLHSARESRDLRPLTRSFLAVSSAQSVSRALYLAVICSEHAPRLDAAKAEALSRGTFLGDVTVRSVIAMCRDWPKLDPGTDSTRHSNVQAPALLLSGELDPVTPPRNAEAARKYLPNAMSVVTHGQGHGAMARGCVRQIVQHFLDEGTTKGLDTSCLEQGHDVRFFTSFAGKEP